VQSRKLTRNSRGSLAEFAPAFMLLLVLYLLPTLALIRLGFSYSAMSMCMSRAVDAAASSPTYKMALARARERVTQMTDSTLGRTCGLKADDIQAVSLLVHEHLIANGKTNTYIPDKKSEKTISATVNTYEYEVVVSYILEPLLTGTNLPLIKNVPLIGAPITLNSCALKAVEYPDGVNEI
jgi:hypothetical protein